MHLCSRMMALMDIRFTEKEGACNTLVRSTESVHLIVHQQLVGPYHGSFECFLKLLDENRKKTHHSITYWDAPESTIHALDRVVDMEAKACVS
jgi:hypothetical protein